MGRIVALAFIVFLVLGLVACKKKEETPILPPPPGAGVVMPPQPTQVIVPENVKNKWSAVKISIDDKTTRTSKDVTIKLGGEYTIAGSNLKLIIGNFLPDFKMEGSVITSASDQPNNPAVRVTVLEGGKEIFKGWLYSKYPAIHPFQHERYGLTLKEGIKG